MSALVDFPSKPYSSKPLPYAHGREPGCGHAYLDHANLDRGPGTERGGKAPAKPAADICPHCDQRIAGSHGLFFSLLASGFKQLAVALVTILFAILRLGRFALAALLCTLGFLGSCARALGNRIAHPDDRRLLKRL